MQTYPLLSGLAAKKIATTNRAGFLEHFSFMLKFKFSMEVSTA